jgi:hypothetical protein
MDILWQRGGFDISNPPGFSSRRAAAAENERFKI